MLADVLFVHRKYRVNYPLHSMPLPGRCVLENRYHVYLLIY